MLLCHGKEGSLSLIFIVSPLLVECTVILAVSFPEKCRFGVVLTLLKRIFRISPDIPGFHAQKAFEVHVIEKWVPNLLDRSCN